MVGCQRSPEIPASDQVLGRVGTVSFPVSCDDEAAVMVERGVAVLHHMTYASAKEIFETAAKVDPDCAMALWGVAMTSIHPLWPDLPSAETLVRGAELVVEARSIGGMSPREEMYVDAVAAYFDGGEARTEHERLVRFATAWQVLYEAHPEDLEAASFFALAHMSVADPMDGTYEKQREAGAIVEGVLAKVPDHPGAHHYIIHAYDQPSLAERALPVARHYGKIAPDVPHALHMPSHIFTMLGLWGESIEWNLRSRDAAWRLSESLGAVSMHHLHALDYLVYAYLQQARDEEALGIVQSAAALAPPFHEVNLTATASHLARMPARYALERQDWAAAAALELRVPAGFPWDEGFSEALATTHFARALGLAHEGRIEEADAEIQALSAARAQIGEGRPSWARHLDVQRLTAQGWVLFLGGDAEAGLARMREAVELRQASAAPAPLGPAELLPAAELLGDMLIEHGRFEEAMVAYERALTRHRGRLNSLYGAGRAAELAGHRDAAAEYYGRVVEQSADAGEARPRVVHARAFSGA